MLNPFESPSWRPTSYAGRSPSKTSMLSATLGSSSTGRAKKHSQYNTNTWEIRHAQNLRTKLRAGQPLSFSLQADLAVHALEPAFECGILLNMLRVPAHVLSMCRRNHAWVHNSALSCPGALICCGCPNHLMQNTSTTKKPWILILAVTMIRRESS